MENIMRRTSKRIIFLASRFEIIFVQLILISIFRGSNSDNQAKISKTMIIKIVNQKCLWISSFLCSNMSQKSEMSVFKIFIVKYFIIQKLAIFNTINIKKRVYYSFHKQTFIFILKNPNKIFSMAQPVLASTPVMASSASETAGVVAGNVSTQALINTLEYSSGTTGIVSILIGLVVLAIVLYLVLRKKKSGTQNVIALIGERYSGKTQLFMRLNGGKVFETVPSIRNNHTSFKMASSRKTYQMSDFCGDGISKDEILHEQNYGSLHTLIHVIDGTDANKLGDAGLFMYRLLVNKSYQKRQCNYILLLNKSDSQNFLTKAKLVKRLQDEIEHIKQSRKNSAQQSQEQEDYLKATRERFNLQRSGIRVVVGAVRNGEVKELEGVLEEVL